MASPIRGCGGGDDDHGFPLTLVAGLALTALFVAAALLSLIWTPHAVEC